MFSNYFQRSTGPGPTETSLLEATLNCHAWPGSSLKPLSKDEFLSSASPRLAQAVFECLQLGVLVQWRKLSTIISGVVAGLSTFFAFYFLEVIMYDGEDIEKNLGQLEPNPLRKIYSGDQADALEQLVHEFSEGKVCDTDKRGFPTPDNRSPLDLMVHAPDGVVPLWAQGTVLRWRFQEASMAVFRDPEAAKTYLRNLLGLGIGLWGAGVPVKFKEAQENWDFEIVVAPAKNCSPRGCTLARAFFPDAGRHELVLFPTLFEQSSQEQVETMAHELGHVFGLRHFFADVSETAWPAERFGKHSKFSIMNYGHDSKMTANDQADLAALYEGFWDGSLTKINETRLVSVEPFSSLYGRQHCCGIAAKQTSL